MSNSCICKPSEVLLFACSGAANVGQISNDAAFELTREGKAKMFCLAGLGGHIPAIIEATKQAKKIIVVDGCPVGCAKSIVEHAGFNIDGYVLVTEAGIEKVPGKTDFTQDEKSTIKNLIMEKVNA